MKKVTRQERIIQLCILLLFFISLPAVFLAPTRQELSVEMNYREADEGICAQLFWGENGKLSGDNYSDGTRNGNVVSFALPIAPSDLRIIRLDPSNTDAPYSVSKITFFLNGEEFKAIRAPEIFEKFIPVNAKVTLSDDSDKLVITPANTDSGLFIDSSELTDAALSASADLRTLQVRQRFFAVLVLTVCMMLLIHHSKPLKQYICSLFQKDEKGHYDWLTLFATAVMAGALLVVVVIGLFSDLGLHPDEWDVKDCLDYGMTHFLPPDMRDPEVAKTYSWYGYTKLDNYTWYFFIAGKVSLLFQKLFYALPYYRIPNILLFAAIALIVVRNVKERKWLMVAFGICVQAWYIFSYTTADALDFFWSFLAVYELSCENSLLYRTVTASKLNRRTFPGLILLGILFGMIALGKPNYLSILALAFFVLVFRLVREKDKAKRSCLWRNYFIIVGIFILTFALRASFDFIHYGLDKASVEEQMAIQYCSPDKNPLTPVEEQAVSWHMMSKGATLSDFFAENPEWFAMTYKSFCGITQLTDTDTWYYVLMGVLYAGIFISIGIDTFRQRDNFWGRMEFAVGTLLMIGGIVASVLNSYIIDSQAQGRYLLPLILIAGYLASRTPGLFEKKYFRALLIAAGFFSVAFFGLRGVPMFL